MFKHILLPTDGSASADIAINAGIRFASEIAARVTALHVVQPFQFEDAPDQEAESVQGRSYLLAIEQLAKEHKVPCDTMLSRSDDIYQAIIQAAFDRQCDLIAMSPHGRKGIRGMLIGSETQKVISNSQVPVLLFR